MLQEAREAAKSVAHLQTLYDMRGDDSFRVTGVRLASFGEIPGVHLHEDILESVSDRSEWTWSERGENNGGYPYRAGVTMFSVEFYAIFSHATAIEYGLEEE